MNKMTAGNLKSAFGGESMAHQRYLIFSDKAEKEGFLEVARLIRAIASAEKIHATNHYKALSELKGDFLVASAAPFGFKDTIFNLQVGINGESFEITEMYPVYLETAKFQNVGSAIRSFTWALETEKMHLSMFKKAKAKVSEGKDYTKEKIQVCGVCGYTIEGKAPEKCPICGAIKEKFVEY